MKDHDVTWLYGPLQQSSSRSFNTDVTPAVSELSRTDSFLAKKPILKKRTASELMLQKSLSASTLMKQAVDALRSQGSSPKTILRNGRPVLGARAYSDYMTLSSPLTPGTHSSTNAPSAFASSSSSGTQTPSERRHIHFNDKVEQCIAINDVGDDHEYHYDDNAMRDSSESEDDGVIMMKTSSRRRSSGKCTTPRGSFSNDSKTIAMLPSTTLKGRNTPEPLEQAAPRTGGLWNRLIQSPSQETIKPSRPSSNFLIDEEEDEDDLSWTPPGTRRDSLYARQVRMSEQQDAEDENNDDEGLQHRGMRRTPSGMFMPYEEDEEDVVAAGLFGRVVDTVNTARDIAHVIWNVGWRR
jgi:hypothetical protein